MDKEIIKRLALNQATESERTAFADWLKTASPTEIEQSTLEFEKHSVSAEGPKAPSELRTRIFAEIEKTQPKEIVKLRPSQTIVWMKYAASLAFLLGVGWLLATTYLKKGNVEWVSLSVPFGERREVILSDSSTVLLNAGSTLRYPKIFAAGQREIELEGEAFFEVTRDEKRPFTVKSGAVDVSVLGTSFNIKNFVEEPIEITVATGLVKVKSILNDSILLKPNQQVRFEKSTGLSPVSLVNAAQVAAWKKGTLVFTNRNLGEIAKQLERHYDKKIILSNNKLVACMPLGEHHNESLESVLSSLQFVLNIEYKITKDSVIIDGKGCN